MNGDIRHLRLRGETNLPEYEKDSSLLTISIHHQGYFTENSHGMSYIGGIVNHFDYCSLDYMSLIELDDMFEKLGYSEKIEAYYKLEECNYVKIVSDSQLMMLLNTDYTQNKLSTSIYVTKNKSPLKKLVAKKSIANFMKPIKDSFGPPHEIITTIPSYPRVAHVQIHSLPPQTNKNTPCDPNALLTQTKSPPIEKPFDVPISVDFNPQKTTKVDDECSDIGSDDTASLSSFSESDYEEDDMLFDQTIELDSEWYGGMYDEGNYEIPLSGDEENLSCNDSSDEDDKNILNHKKHWPEFNKFLDMEKPRFKVGMTFPTTDLLKDAVMEHSIQFCRQVKIKKKEKYKLQALCKEPCKWYLYASKLQHESTIQVKKHMNVHTCNREFVNDNVTAKYLGKYYGKMIRSNPQWPIEAFQEQVRADLKVEVSIYKLYRAKDYAINQQNGTLTDQFKILHDYVVELKLKNPDTTVVIEGDVVDVRRFGRIYICLGALKKGMKQNCRPLIGLDGCHLKGCTGGIMLSAIGIDGNNSMYPVAYAIVESENTKSWTWFLKLLRVDLEIVNSFGWTFMSDKQKGLLNAIHYLFPNCEHRCCLRHLYNNFKKENRGLVLKDAMYAAARATTVPHWQDLMAELDVIDSKAFAWLDDKVPTQWAKSHFSIFVKSDMLLNNLCESFNSMINDARRMPIISMLEKIRCILMKRIHVNKIKMSKIDGLLCPKIQALLEKIKEEAAYCSPNWNGESKFEVDGPGGKYVCDLNELTCACRKWDLTGIPCKHAVSALSYAGIEPESVVHQCYLRENYLQCYSNSIQPLNGSLLWVKTGMTPVLPPIYAVKAGKKQTRRRLEPDEKTKQVKKNRMGRKPSKEDPSENQAVLGKKYQQSLKCGNCETLGHNKRSCELPIVEKPPKSVKRLRKNATSEGETNCAQNLPAKKIKKNYVKEYISQSSSSQPSSSQSRTVMQAQAAKQSGISSSSQPKFVASRGEKVMFMSQPNM